MASNDFDAAVDQIATFFKEAAKLQQFVKDMGMDKPAPPTGAGFSEARDLFEAWAEEFGKRTKWGELDRDTQYCWLSIVKKVEKK
jgi:hypothetical protein